MYNLHRAKLACKRRGQRRHSAKPRLGVGIGPFSLKSSTGLRRTHTFRVEPCMPLARPLNLNCSSTALSSLRQDSGPKEFRIQGYCLNPTTISNISHKPWCILESEVSGFPAENDSVNPRP